MKEKIQSIIDKLDTLCDEDLYELLHIINLEYYDELNSLVGNILSASVDLEEFLHEKYGVTASYME